MCDVLLRLGFRGMTYDLRSVQPVLGRVNELKAERHDRLF